MKAASRNLAITVVLVVIAAAAGAALCARFVVNHHARSPSLHEVVHRKLDLTAEQRRRLDAIEARYATDRRRLEDEVRAANRELALAIRNGHRDSPEVEAAIDHLHHAMGALQKATISHVFEMRAVLTPDQVRVFDAEVVAALTEDGR